MGVNELNLCPFYVDLVEKGPVAGDSTAIAHHSTYGALVTSSENCALCACLCSLLPRPSLLLSEGGTCEERPFHVELAEHNEQVSPDVSWGQYKVGVRSLVVPTTVSAKFTLAIRRSEGLLPKLSAWQGCQTTWDEKLLTIGEWLQNCRHDPSHTRCRPRQFLPSRLVSVGVDGRPPRLIHTEKANGNENMEYATLSYCWGRLLPLRTTTTTLAQFTQELPPRLIPATFAEAMRIARMAGIPYIWIDALCIIQDDIEDWQHEAATMDMVYGGSQLTIAASQSADSFAGCFPLTAIEGHSSRDALFRHRGSGRCVRFYDGDIRNRPTSDNCLSSRAWSLQEQLLSPRVVSCLQEMHWQCHGSHKVENGLSFGPVRDTETDARVPLRIPRMLPPQAGTPGAVRLRAAWENVVEAYSGRLLTFEQDRIPAIAGILQHFASVLNDEPVLGLWKTTIARDMAWARLWVRRPAKAPGDPMLPSWTWLACPGAATFRHLNEPLPDDPGKGPVQTDAKTHVRLLGWDVQWLETPYTSPLRSAFIRIEAPAMLIDIRPTEEEMSGAFRGYYQVFGENLTNTAGVFRYRCFGYFDRQDLTEPATHLCLLLSTGRDGETDEVYEVFVIIQPVGLPEKGRYRRIGAARLRGTTPSFDLQKTMSIVLE